MTNELTGRELDAAVAERVMGYKLGGIGREGLCKSPGGWSFIRSYSTAIAAAWEVVERMRERGWNVEITTWPDAASQKYGAGPWWCEVSESSGEDYIVLASIEASTAPEAICRAALAAVEAEGE